MAEPPCCTALQTLIERYELPFYRPLAIDPKTFEFKTYPISIKLRNLTKAGKVSQKDRATVIMYYCPICGTKLYDDGQDDEEE